MYRDWTGEGEYGVNITTEKVGWKILGVKEVYLAWMLKIVEAEIWAQSDPNLDIVEQL